jgi:FG-GAP-like repeat
VTGYTQIHRSADGTRFFFMESNISNGPVFTYSAISNTFGPRFYTDTYLDTASGAVSRYGNLVALRLPPIWDEPPVTSLNTAPDFNFLHVFPIDRGVAFDAVRNVLYGVNSGTDQIIAYSTNTFAELFRLTIGEDIPPFPTLVGTGTLLAGADGWIALETDSGIRLFQIPNATHPTDFNRDGKPDYALFNASTHQTAIWYFSGVMFIGSAWGPTLPSGWALVATGEFNNDGKPDYVIYNSSTRQTAVWYLNNNAYIGGAYGPSIPAP